jgi:hypothetical protein
MYFLGISVRKFLLIVLTSLAAMGAHAWEPSSDDSHPEGTFAQPPYAEALVTIAPVPMPGAVVELTSYSPRNTAKQVKTVKATKVAQAKSMLSRSARGQIALASTAAKADDHERLDASDDEDDDPGLDDQDLHRSFSQPKVAKKPDQADDADNAAIDLPEHIKLRLLMARTKAVDAHILSQAGKASNSIDEDLPENVKLRLFMARSRAVKALMDKFGEA